jgi:hypothetical protein
LEEIGAHASALLPPLYSPPLHATAPRLRHELKERDLSPVLIESGLGLCDLYRGRKHLSVSLTLPNHGNGEGLSVIGRVRFNEMAGTMQQGFLMAVPASGAHPYLFEFLWENGVGPYNSQWNPNSLFSNACLAKIKPGRERRADYGKAFLDWRAKWNGRPAGEGPFESEQHSALGHPFRWYRTTIEVDSIPAAGVDLILHRLSPGLKRSDCESVGGTCGPTHLYLPRSKKSPAAKPCLYVQIFAVSESETDRSAVVVDGRLRYGRLGADVHARMDRLAKRRARFMEEERPKKPSPRIPPIIRVDEVDDGEIKRLLPGPDEAALKRWREEGLDDNSAFEVRLHEFLRRDPITHCERAMTYEDFCEANFIEETPNLTDTHL